MSNYVVFELCDTFSTKLIPINEIISITAMEDGTMLVRTRDNVYYTCEITFGE